MTKFIDNQRRIWKSLTWLLMCRYYLEKDKTGKWCIKKTPTYILVFYYAIWTNTIIKVTYLFLTYHGWLNEVHFLDQMSIWDWGFCFILLVQETNIWYRKYPLYEVLHANWTILEDAFKKLGSPDHIQNKIIKNDNQLQVMHLFIVFGGCFALMIQFFMSPKYALNTYSIIPFDNFVLRCVFAAHEYFFMMQCWLNQTFTIVLVEVSAVSYAHILTEMTSVMYKLIEMGEGATEDNHDAFKNSAEIFSRVNGNHFIRKTSPGRHYKDEDGDVISVKSNFSIEGSDVQKKKIRDTLKIKERRLDPKSIVPGTEYDVLTLVADYKKLTLAMNQFNDWVGKRMAGTDAASYCQFISDVFMMIQLLKEPDVDFLGVFFFFEDACAGMILLFRMLILQSRLLPAAQEFLHAFKSYIQYDTPLRHYFLKTIPSLRTIASKIGGYSVRPSTVPVGINILMNFYISAAMWQRPKDRLT